MAKYHEDPEVAALMAETARLERALTRANHALIAAKEAHSVAREAYLRSDRDTLHARLQYEARKPKS